MDMASVNKWEDYTAAKEEMFRTTDTDLAPWIVVKSNDKKRAPHQRHATPARQVRLPTTKTSTLCTNPIRYSSDAPSRISGSQQLSRIPAALVGYSLFTPEQQPEGEAVLTDGRPGRQRHTAQRRRRHHRVLVIGQH
jgi:Polyphosphate kinase 2 (PPK2)